MDRTAGARRTHTPPRDGVLLRLPVDGADWAEGLPPPPARASVTVSFSAAGAASRFAAAVGDLGYQVVGIVASAEASDLPVADFLVPAALAQAHPVWYRSLSDRAQHAFNLAFGPVAAQLDGVLQAHR